MINMDKAIKSDRVMKSITGMSAAEFLAIIPVFAGILYEESLAKDRERLPGAGAAHTLGSPKDKLFYTLFYIKCYPTFDLAAFFYGVDRSQTCRWSHTFIPLLEKTLGRKLVLPERQIRDAAEFIRLFPEVKEVFIDGTERPVQRSRDSKKQRANYSGKKKRHTRKNIIVTDAAKRILILTPTDPGSTHDYTDLKEHAVAENLPDNTIVNVDLGFQGIKNDYPDLNIRIPHKKPRGKELTEERKEENRKISSRRVLVENAIGGVKRLKSLTDIFRNKKEKFDDMLMNVGCGLWNLHLVTA